MCSSVGRATVSKAVGRGFESLRTRWVVVSSKRGINVGAEVKSMDIKKTQQTTPTQILSTKRVQEFASEIKGEIQKITWTSRDELIFYTKLVVGATFLFGMAIYLLDLLIQASLVGLDFILRFISG